MLRVLLAGSRNWPWPEVIYSRLDLVFAQCGGPIVLVHGDCPTGADHYGDIWAQRMKSQGFDVEVERHPAKWKQFGKSAGYRRNAEMVALGADLCLVFILDESEGSRHTERTAKKAGIVTRTVRRTTMPRVEKPETLEGVTMIFRNFTGAERLPYNAAGDRNFSIAMDKATALHYRDLGWNVKESINKSDPTGDPYYHLPVRVSFKGRPPKLFTISNFGTARRELPEEDVYMLDRLEFDLVDVSINPYNWRSPDGRNTGVTAYLTRFYGVLHEDPLDYKYRGVGMELEAGATPPDVLAIESGLTLHPEQDFVDSYTDEDTGWVNDEERPALPAPTH